jgi:hypothetical protein
MAKNLFTSLFNALSDPKSYYAMQKEMNLKAVAQTFFNVFAGQTTFDAVILPEDIGQPVIFDGKRAVRVRPLNIYDLIIPEPCSFDDVDVRRRILALHPIAYPDASVPNTDTAPASPAPTVMDARVVECFFRDGPQANGRLRGLTYRPKSIRTAGANRSIDYRCLYAAGFQGPSEMFGDGGYKPNQPTGETFPDGTKVTTKFGGKHEIEKEERKLKPTNEVVSGIGAPSAAVFAKQEIQFWANKNEKDVIEKGKTIKSNPAYKRIQLYAYYVQQEGKKSKGESYRDWPEYVNKYNEDEKVLKAWIGGASSEGTGDSVTGIMHWSATSVSFCMRGTGFPARQGHSAYTKNIAWGKAKGWQAFSLIRQKVFPKLGDVVVKPAGHGRKSTTYTASHGDIIYKIDKEYAYTAGGNLGARGEFREAKKIKLAKDGTILSPQPYIIILKKME